MSDKEQCFDDAMEDYNNAMLDAKKKPIDIQFQQKWVQNPDGTWSQAPPTDRWWQFWKWWNSAAPAPRGQLRVPDITMKGPDGNTLWVDKKFTRADGSVDTWGTQPGKDNGRTQKQDYNNFNKQNNPGNPDAVDLALDPESCNCEGDAQEQEAPALAPVVVPIPGLGVVPGAAGAWGELWGGFSSGVPAFGI